MSVDIYEKTGPSIDRGKKTAKVRVPHSDVGMMCLMRMR